MSAVVADDDGAYRLAFVARSVADADGDAARVADTFHVTATATTAATPARTAPAAVAAASTPRTPLASSPLVPFPSAHSRLPPLQPLPQTPRSPRPPSTLRTVWYLSGASSAVQQAQISLLRDAAQRASAAVRVPTSLLLAPAGDADAIRPSIQQRLDALATATGARINVAHRVPRDAAAAAVAQSESEAESEIRFQGTQDAVALARIRILVLIDELNGLESDTCELDCTLHNIVGGRKRCVIQTIQAETGTSIYLAPGTFGWFRADPEAPAPLSALANTVLITGPRTGVQRAHEMLLQIASHKTSVLLHKPADLPPGKRDWLLLNHHSKLAEIARDNATFLSLPPLGNDAPHLVVYGDNRASIERTLRAMMALSTELYLASIQLAPPVPRVINPGFEAFSTPARPVEPFASATRTDSVVDVVQSAAAASGAEVAAQRLASGVWGMELSGTAAEVKAALAAVLNHTWTQSFEAHVTVNLELATEHRDFLSGKKNGKVNKVMRLSNVQIVYNEGNAYNFVIQLSAVGRGWDLADPSPGPLEGAERSNVLLGLTYLQEELPAEIAFYVPEAYHKRIIGVGGKNIQRIMKRYGVYVKFSSAEEAAWGGCLPTEDNVVARTPAKNAAGSLLPLKQAVLEMVAPKDRDFTSLLVPLARGQHRVLASDRALVLHDLEARTSCSITFPPRETGEQSVTLYGPSVQLPLVAHVVLEQVPYQASLQVRPPNASLLQDRLASPEFGVLLDVLRREYSVRATVSQAPVDSPPSPPSASDKEAGVNFHLITTRAQAEWVPIAKQMLTTFFSSGSHPPTPASVSTPLVSPSVRTMGLPSRFSTPASLPDSPVYRPHIAHPLPPHPARYAHGSLPEQERRALPLHARHNSHASHRSFGSGGSNVSAGPPPPLPLPPQGKRYPTHTHTLSGNLLWNKPERDWANASPRARAVWDNPWPAEAVPSPGPNPVGSPVWATSGRTERAHSLDYRVPPRLDQLERGEGYEAFDGAAYEPPFDPTTTWDKLDPPFAPARARPLGPLGLYEPEPYGERGEAHWEPDPYDPSLHDARVSDMNRAMQMWSLQ